MKISSAILEVIFLKKSTTPSLNPKKATPLPFGSLGKKKVVVDGVGIGIKKIAIVWKEK